MVIDEQNSTPRKKLAAAQVCRVAIVGTGPYGLSLAAHFRDRGVDFRIFGKPMDLWRNHMPKGMMLKSEGFASNLNAPDARSSLKHYCELFDIPYADEGVPIPLSDFVAYADWFTARHVPTLEAKMVTNLELEGNDFLLTLETGERVKAEYVVLAVGITWFPYLPQELASLPNALVSHSYDHRTVDQFANKRVIVIGAGASAVNLAYELNEVRSDVSILVRGSEIEYHVPPSERVGPCLYRLRNPASPIGPGWKSLFCAALPGIFYYLPEKWRSRAVRSHLRPAAGWFMREKVESDVPTLLERKVESAVELSGRLQLALSDGTRLDCDHVIASTGYRTDLSRLHFLSDDIRNRIRRPECAMHVGRDFQTDLKGLYAIGPMAMENFGPLLRFMAGSQFVSRRLSNILRRRIAIRTCVQIIRQLAKAWFSKSRLTLITKSTAETRVARDRRST